MKLPLPILLRIVRTAAGVWLASRFALALIGVSVLFGLGYLWFFMITVVMTWVDIGNARERLLFANLGVSSQAVILITAVVVVTLEFTVGTLLAPLFVAIAPDISI